MGFAWALLNAGELEASETRLEDVERSLSRDEVPEAEVPRLRRSWDQHALALPIRLAQSFQQALSDELLRDHVHL